METFIEQITPHHPKAQTLLQAAVREIACLYPGNDHDEPPQEKAETGLMVVAWLEGEVVACGVLRTPTPSIGEIKRLYVLPDHRRRGLARQVLKALENLAIRIRLETIRLRTGSRQPGALALYESVGYQRITCPKVYANDPLCVCFEKRLTTPERETGPPDTL